MPQYALRCLETDYNQLLQNAKILGAIDIVDGKPVPVDGTTWIELGYKRIGEPPLEGEPDTRPFTTGAGGVKYVHINASTEFDIGDKAAELAAAYPEIAAGLSQLGKFFILNADGKASWPEDPMCVFL